ncbi:unnamed protein product, partial [Cyprideis torosa]
MEKLVIEGGIPLRGEVVVSGAKNAALPLIAATLLCPGRHILTNVPDLKDTRTFLKLLEGMGAEYHYDAGELVVDTTHLHSVEASYELVKTMRASVLVLGPLIARMGRAKVSLPGGCAIGERPIDFHIRGFEQMNVRMVLEHGYVEAQTRGRLQGASVYFDVPTVTGTENILMAATLAEGTTVIKNAAREPEIENLIDMLVSMGATIEGRGTDKLFVHGAKALHPARCRIIPDRIEAGTYLLAAAATNGEVMVSNCEPAHLPALLEKMRSAGFTIEESGDSLCLSKTSRGEVSPSIAGVNIKTMPYPGFPTDLQAQFMALMTLADGVSVINETIFENRFMHVAELRRMGANIQIDGKTAIVHG